MSERKLDIKRSLKELAEEGWTAKELWEAFTLYATSETEVKADTKKKDLIWRATEILHEIGVPAHIKGYQYIRHMIIMAIEDKNILKSMTKEMYPKTAEEFGTTAPRVERAVRHAIEVAWDRGDLEIFQEYFGNTISSQKGKPTNSEFIAMIVDKFYLEGYVADQ